MFHRQTPKHHDQRNSLCSLLRRMLLTPTKDCSTPLIRTTHHHPPSDTSKYSVCHIFSTRFRKKWKFDFSFTLFYKYELYKSTGSLLLHSPPCTLSYTHVMLINSSSCSCMFCFVFSFNLLVASPVKGQGCRVAKSGATCSF